MSKKKTKSKTTRAVKPPPLKRTRKGAGAVPKKPQQEFFNHGEDGRIPELADAIDALAAASKAWSDAAATRDRASTEVLRLLHVHKRTTYRSGNVTVTLTRGTEKVALKRDKSDTVQVYDFVDPNADADEVA